MGRRARSSSWLTPARGQTVRRYASVSRSSKLASSLIRSSCGQVKGGVQLPVGYAAGVRLRLVQLIQEHPERVFFVFRAHTFRGRMILFL
jgi:hypothetical protein